MKRIAILVVLFTMLGFVPQRHEPQTEPRPLPAIPSQLAPSFRIFEPATRPTSKVAISDVFDFRVRAEPVAPVTPETKERHEVTFDCGAILNPSPSAYYDRGVCVPGIITNETWYTPSPRNFIGRATWYPPGWMRRIGIYRGMYTDGFLGGVSLFSPADIGEVVWLRRPGLDWEGPYLVVDASQRNHMYATLGHVGESVEVDFNTAVRWGMAGWTRFGPHWVIEWKMLDVEVWKGIRPPKRETAPVNYGEWFLDRVEFDWYNTYNQRWNISTAKIKNYIEYGYLLTGHVRPDVE